ncbi:MAG: Eco57I restriction-modification methylase domain-containing protein, partial [Pyrinomonadaceae bacterium]
MSFNPLRVRQHLERFDFRGLFIEELGWSHPAGRQKVTTQVDGATFERTQVAQLGGVVVYELTAADGVIPDAKTRRSVHAEISKFHHENLLIFLDRERTQSLWYWAKRESGKLYPRDHIFMRGQPADLFLQKLSAMVVDISEMDEAGNVAVTEAASKLKAALDVERVTKKFYAAFREQHLAFLEQIKGIDDEHDRRWYASVLLNRLMFIYFLQSKGFIKGRGAAQDYKYLQNELKRSRERGADRYYGEFLDTLFFEGFAKPEDRRGETAKRLIGGVPYLNGGLFLRHGIESRWTNITIADAAFENLFGLFDSYSWNLNDTPGGKADEINPDVLGYIFEKYINQKAFGAYYTRTEITQYLCEQTIYKLILDRINAYALPASSTQHTGELFTVKDHNLFASRRFDSTGDLLLNLDSFYCQKLLQDILPDMKLLDPACGSGAFLVAAMKTLVNIYQAVISHIEFHGDAAGRQWLGKLRGEHSSLSYYVKREIIKNNLFGVDIMEEATEIAKLRLFLALVASVERAEQLEPLPNIDFNILTGHSLIGLLRIDESEFDQRHAAQGNLFQKAYRDFVRETTNDIRVYRQAASFEQDLRNLRDNIEVKKREVTETLDEILLDQFGGLGIRFEQAAWDEGKNKEGKTVKRKLTIDDIRHLRPFHWGFEFDDVMNRGGGFDAIITNPPWEIFKPQAKEFFA